MLLHSIAKSVVKPIFRRYPTPHFSLQNLRFPRFSPFRTRFRAIFRGIALVFCPVKPIFFSSFLVLGPTSGTFSRNISRFSLPVPHFQFMLPNPSPSSPLSFSFLPTFPSSSPINARTRAPSRITCVRVHPHLPARQEVFVFFLHRFTNLPQSAVHQHIRCEGKQEKAFTKNSITSQSRH